MLQKEHINSVFQYSLEKLYLNQCSSTEQMKKEKKRKNLKMDENRKRIFFRIEKKWTINKTFFRKKRPRKDLTNHKSHTNGKFVKVSSKVFMLNLKIFALFILNHSQINKCTFAHISIFKPTVKYALIPHTSFKTWYLPYFIAVCKWLCFFFYLFYVITEIPEWKNVWYFL